MPKLWEHIEAHRAFLVDEGLLEQRRREHLAAEVFAVASARAKVHLEHAVAGILSSAGCSTRYRAESSTRSPRFERSLTRCSILATETTGPTLTEIEVARRGLANIARETPVYASDTFSRLAGREVVLKAENLQRTGSFKVRGAVTRIAALTEPQRAAGVVAASAGNHGQAVAWAAREAGIPAAIFVPQDAPMSKVEACRNYSADTELTGLTFEEALAAAFAYAEETGATFVHPYEDEAVIAGQGTIGLELAEQVPQAETVLVPVGGGGLASGIALALRAVKPGSASSASRSGATDTRSPTESRSRSRASSPRRSSTTFSTR